MKKIAVFTSGGDAPGMNACIRAVVRTAIYHGLDVYGIKYGYDGIIKGDIYKMKSYTVSNIVQKGGTILKSARSEDFRTVEGRRKAAKELKQRGIEGLVVIGGDGSLAGAEVFYEEYKIPFVGCPGTIDNDLYGTDYTIGFDTAVNTALDSIDKIRDTANSHDRIFFVEVMGRDSGYIAIQSGMGGGAECVMVPETITTMGDLMNTLEESWSRDKTSAIIVVAEGDEEGNAMEISSKVRQEYPEKDIKVTTLGHVQRGGRPSAYDRILSSRLGIGAVEGLITGKTAVMAGIVNDTLVYTPVKECINQHKPINPDLLRAVTLLGI